MVCLHFTLVTLKDQLSRSRRFGGPICHELLIQVCRKLPFVIPTACVVDRQGPWTSCQESFLVRFTLDSVGEKYSKRYSSRNSVSNCSNFFLAFLIGIFTNLLVLIFEIVQSSCEMYYKSVKLSMGFVMVNISKYTSPYFCMFPLICF